MSAETSRRMRSSAVRAVVVALSCALLVAIAPVQAATCAKICSTGSLWGYGGVSTNYAPCECSGDTPGARMGANGCGCGECYQYVGSKVFGYAKQNGQCQSGSEDCGDCDIASGSGSGSKNTTTTTTTAPPSTNGAASNASSPSLTPSSPSATSSSATDSGTAPTSSSSNGTTTDTKTSSSSGLATWQIALIICSSVLVIAVVMMTITSCYCKARNQMKDNMKNEEERQEYEGYWNPNGSEDRHNEQLAQSAFGPTMTQGGRSSFNSAHSRPSSNKNVPYSEPTYVDDRIGGRATPRRSLGSTADLPGVYQPFPQRGPHDPNSRNNIAIEL